MREAVTVDSASREFDGIRAEIYKAQKICLLPNTEELSQRMCRTTALLVGIRQIS